MTKARGTTRANRPESKLAVAVRRSPTQDEVVAMEAAAEARAKRAPRIRPPKIETIYQGPNALGISSPHSDAEGWGVQMMEAFGVDSYAVVERLMMGAGQVAPQGGVTSQEDAEEAQRRSSGALAFVASMQPKSTIEATLSLQMLAAHEASMKMSGHLHNCTTREGLSDYSRMMNQTMRTFAAQVEALAKLRSGGKQQVEVRYVYVDARTQTVVNEGGGGGAPFGNREQPHAPGTLGVPFAPGLPVWGEDAGRDAVPVTGGQRAEAMPDARGSKPRRSEGRGERQLRLRTVDGRDHTGAGDGAGHGETLSGDAA